MAIGEFGAKIEDNLYLATGGAHEPFELSSGVFCFPDLSNNNLKACTFSCDANGDISANLIDAGSIVGSNVVFNSTKIFHINGTVYGVFAQWHAAASPILRAYATTFNINPDGTFGGVIAHFALGTLAVNEIQPNFETVFHIAGTIYATAWERHYAPNYYLNVKTWDISDDGTSLSLVNVDASGDLLGDFGVAFKHISGNIYAVFLTCWSGVSHIRTFEITDIGGITHLNSLTFEATALGSAPFIKACHVYGNIWAIAYYYYPTDKHRVRTLEINNDGSFGSLIDVNEAIFASDNVYSFSLINSGVYLLTSGDAGGLSGKSFPISDAGDIGAIIDALAGISGWNVYLLYLGSNNIYTGIYKDASFNTRGVSYELQAELTGNRFVIMF